MKETDMTDFVIAPPETPSVAVVDSAQRFPIIALAPGDLIFSGTPAGVGPLQPGDEVEGGVEGVVDFTFTIGPKSL